MGALNQNVLLGIRPEHISISFSASCSEDNLIKTTITRVQFLGAITRVALDAGGLSLDPLVLRLVGLEVGDKCMPDYRPAELRSTKTKH